MATTTPRIVYVEGAAPGTPAAGLVYVYAKADGLMYSKDDAGVETALGAGTAVTDATIATTDVTTNNASTSKHGWLKKLSNVSTEFMNGVGNWATPAAGAPNNYESYLSTDVTCVNAFGTAIYSHASLAITPAAGDYEITAEVSVTSAVSSAGAAIGILATGGSLASNVLTGHTVVRDTLQYNSASNGGGTIKCIVSARLTLNGSTVVRVAIGAGAGSSDAIIRTSNVQGGTTVAANKASRISATAITPL